jgi:hypothetical protein
MPASTSGSLSGLQLGAQPGEVAAAVHERQDHVPGGEGPQVSSRVRAIALGEEPPSNRLVVHRLIRGILHERVIRQVDRICTHGQAPAADDPPAFAGT